MKKIVITTVLFAFTIINANAQLTVSAPAAEILLSTIQGILTTDSGTHAVTKSETVNNALTNAKQLEEAYRVAEKLSKVADYIKKGQTIMSIYETETRILKKVKQLKNSQSKEFGSSDDLTKVTNAVLDATGRLVDKAIQVVSDDVFNMEDFQREKSLESILKKLQQIEALIARKSYKNNSASIDLKYHSDQDEQRKKYDDIMKARREKINQIK